MQLPIYNDLRIIINISRTVLFAFDNNFCILLNI